jgi:FKBP-type peptidyl-prolyl cis-trans isomerase SlpA
MASHAPRISAGSFLTLHYRLAGPAGDIINTFDGKPATLTLGSGELAPAVEQRLIGLEEGARATFDIPAGEAFGAVFEPAAAGCGAGWGSRCVSG